MNKSLVAVALYVDLLHVAQPFDTLAIVGDLLVEAPVGADDFRVLALRPGQHLLARAAFTQLLTDDCIERIPW